MKIQDVNVFFQRWQDKKAMCRMMVMSDPTVVLSSKDTPNLSGEKEGKPVEASGLSGDALAPLTSEELSEVQEKGLGATLEGSRKQKVHDVWIPST